MTEQVTAFDVFHHQIPYSSLHAGIVGLHDIVVGQFSRGFYFPLEAFDGRLVFGHRRRQQLDGDKSFHVPVLSFEDLPHTTRANSAE